MPIEHALWKVGQKPTKLEEATLDSEQQLEDMITQDLSILNDQWLLIGRQVRTDFNKSIDLLALDNSGSVIIIELKKNKTPREVVAQSIDYASWVKDVDSSKLADIYESYAQKYADSELSLDEAFLMKFGTKIEEDNLNSSHQMLIVASELDSSTERIVRYLSEYSIAINIVFFRVFVDNGNKYLSRAWFLDPTETQEQATAPRGSEPWNGEFYVSFGHGSSRNWEDARKYGFISGGAGRWYSRTLNMLSEGDRVWVNIPGTGYVGVGIVEKPAVKADEFEFDSDDGPISFFDLDLNADYYRDFVADDDKAEYLVGVKWVQSVPVAQAKSEVGFFGNQNTVAKPTTPKWPHTVERLHKLFDVEM